MKVGHQHCSSLEINHTITACFYLFQRGRIQLDGLLGGRGLGRRLRAGSTLDFAVEGNAAVFGMHGAIVTEEEVSSHEGAATFGTFEGSLFGICARRKGPGQHEILFSSF